MTEVASASKSGEEVQASRQACSYSFEKGGQIVAKLVLWPVERILIGFQADHPAAPQAAEELASTLGDQVRPHTLQKKKFYFVAIASGDSEGEDAVVEALTTFLVGRKPAVEPKDAAPDETPAPRARVRASVAKTSGRKGGRAKRTSAKPVAGL